MLEFKLTGNFDGFLTLNYFKTGNLYHELKGVKLGMKGCKGLKQVMGWKSVKIIRSISGVKWKRHETQIFLNPSKFGLED